MERVRCFSNVSTRVRRCLRFSHEAASYLLPTGGMSSNDPFTSAKKPLSRLLHPGRFLVITGIVALIMGAWGLREGSSDLVWRAKASIASSFGLTFDPVVDQAESIPETHVAAVRPRGWRRTKNGWEHTSTWRPKRSLAAILNEEQEREQHWVQHFLNGVRGVPPVAYACLQIAAISCICWISQFSKKSLKLRTAGQAATQHRSSVGNSCGPATSAVLLAFQAED